jgi:hypothetical protein
MAATGCDLGWMSARVPRPSDQSDDDDSCWIHTGVHI